MPLFLRPLKEWCSNFWDSDPFNNLFRLPGFRKTGATSIEVAFYFIRWVLTSSIRRSSEKKRARKDIEFLARRDESKTDSLWTLERYGAVVG